MDIGGPDPTDLCNLAYVRTALGQYDDGAAAARAALRLDPSFAAAHLILGTLLQSKNGARAEAIDHLRRAAETMESARETLRRIDSAQQ